MSARWISKQVSSSWSHLIFRKSLVGKAAVTRPFNDRVSPFHQSRFSTSRGSDYSSRAIQELLADLERERQREREARKRAGLDTKDIDAEAEEDFMGVGPLIEKLEKEKLKDPFPANLNAYEEPTDSESDEDDDRFTPENMRKRTDEFDKKFKRHEEILENFVECGKAFIALDK